MRFTTNAEAAKGNDINSNENKYDIYFVAQYKTEFSKELGFLSISLGMNGDGYGGESTAILIDKALEHQNALGVSDDIFGHGSSIDYYQTKSYCWMR